MGFPNRIHLLGKGELITSVYINVGTTHDNAAINLSVNQVAKEFIKEGTYDQGILNKVEIPIRAYGP